MNTTDKTEVLAMIDYSNVEIQRLIDKVAMEENQSAIHHWVDQFYKILKANANKLQVNTKK